MDPINNSFHTNLEYPKKIPSAIQQQSFAGRKISLENDDNVKNKIPTETKTKTKTKTKTDCIQQDISTFNNNTQESNRIKPTDLTSRLITIKEPEYSKLNFLKNKIKSLFWYSATKLYFKIFSNITKVRDSVEQSGGTINFKFSQMKGTWQAHMRKDSKTFGHCFGLCVRWIEHKNNDTNLFHSLYNGDKKGKIDPDAFESVRAIQELTISSNQYEIFDEIAKKNNLENLDDYRARYKSKPPGSYKMPIYTTTDNKELRDQRNIDFSDALGDALIYDEHDNNYPIYKITHIVNSKGEGHCMTCTLNKNSVCFFDPNYGEFEFPNKELFKAWFKNHYWTKSVNGGRIPGFNHDLTAKFTVDAFQKKQSASE